MSSGTRRRNLQTADPAKRQYEMATRSSRRASVDAVQATTLPSKPPVRNPASRTSLGGAALVSSTKEEDNARQREKATVTRPAAQAKRRTVSEFGELQRERDHARKDAYASLSKRADTTAASDQRKTTQTSRHRSDSASVIGPPRPLKKSSVQAPTPSSLVARTGETLPDLRSVSSPSEIPPRNRNRTVSDPPQPSAVFPASQNPPAPRTRRGSNSSNRITPTQTMPPRPRTASGSSTMPTPPPRYSNLSSRPPSRQSDRSRSNHDHVVQPTPMHAPPPTPIDAPPGLFPRGILRRRPYPPKSLTVATTPRTVSLQAPNPSLSSPRSPSIVDLVRRLSKKRVRFKSVSSRRTISDAGTPYASPAHSPPRRRTTRDLPAVEPSRRTPLWRSATPSSRVSGPVQPTPSYPRGVPPSAVRPDRRVPSPNPHLSLDPAGPPPYIATSASSRQPLHPSAAVSTRTRPSLSQHTSVTPRRAPSPINPPRVIPPTPPVNGPRALFGRTPSPTQSPHIIPAPPSPILSPRGLPMSDMPPSRRTRAPSPAMGMSLVGVEGPYPSYHGRDRRDLVSSGSSDRSSVPRASRLGYRSNIPPPAPAIDLSVGPGNFDRARDDDDEPVGAPSTDRWGDRHHGFFNRLGWRTRARSTGMYGDDEEIGDGYFPARRRRWRGLFGLWGRRVGGDSWRPRMTVRLRLRIPWLKRRRSMQRLSLNAEFEPDIVRDVERSPSLPPLPPPSPPHPPMPLEPMLPPLPPPPRSRAPSPSLPALHPLLRAASRSHPSHLTWDMRYPDLPSHYASSPFIRQGLSEPATNPPSETMTLLIPIPQSSSRSRSSPTPAPQFWATTLKPPRSAVPYVKCIDILKSAASSLRQPLTHVEVDSLSFSARRSARVQRAFEQRCRGGDAMGQRSEEKERSIGMRRVDLLGNNVVWSGVKWDDEAEAWVVELGETEI